MVVAAATPTIVSSAVVPSTTPSVAPTVLIATATPPPITPSAPKIIKIVNNGAVVAAGAVVATAKPVGAAAATTTPTPAAPITSTAAATPTAVATANSADVKNQLIQKVLANNKLKQKLQQTKPTATAATIESTDKNDDADGNAAASAKPDSFVVTPDYIQQSNFCLFY